MFRNTNFRGPLSRSKKSLNHFNENNFRLQILEVTFWLFFSFFVVVQIRAIVNLFFLFTKKETLEELLIESVLESYPYVLIQIPVYMEGWEVMNCTLAALGINYPKDRFCVQVVDDSPNELPELVDFLKKEAEKKGVDFMYLYRPNRHGFKSGALNYGMTKKRSDFVLILDADFVISENFLINTLPYFSDEEVACVQTRWVYRNSFKSGIITVQTTIFEILFALEQSLRMKLNIPAFFTGTSGIWRSRVIHEIGGWREKPFTAEDIDLSFKAYERGYNLIYLDTALSTCEATPDYLALKSQQQRWARGVIQAGIHNGPKIFRAKQSWTSRLQEISTGLFNLIPILLLVLSFTISGFILFGYDLTKNLELAFFLLTVMIFVGPISMGIILAVIKYNKRINFQKFFYLSWAACLGVGISWSMILGIWEVFTKSKREFVVTPKGDNFKTLANKWKSDKVLKIFLEGFVLVYFSWIMFIGFSNYKVTIPMMAITSLSGLVSLITSLASIIKVK